MGELAFLGEVECLGELACWVAFFGDPAEVAATIVWFDGLAGTAGVAFLGEDAADGTEVGDGTTTTGVNGDCGDCATSGLAAATDAAAGDTGCCD